MCEQKTQAENLQSQAGNVNQKLENYQGNTDRRLENLTDMVRNVSTDREQAHSNLGAARSIPTPPVINQIPRGPNLGFCVDGQQDREIPKNLRRDVDRSSIGGTESSRGFNSVPMATDLGTNLIPENKSLEQESIEKPPTEIHQDAIIKNTSVNQVIRKSYQQFEDDQPDSLQHASMIQQWWPSTRQITSRSHRQLEDSQRIKFLQNKRSPTPFLKVNPNYSLETRAFQIESKETSELVIEPMEIGWVDIKFSSTAMVIMLGAHQVFDKLLEKEMGDFDDSVHSLSIFGGVFYSIDSSSFVFDPGKNIDFKVNCLNVEVGSVVVMVERGERNESIFVFDLGGETDSMVFNVYLLLVVLDREKWVPCTGWLNLIKDMFWMVFDVLLILFAAV